MRVSMMLIEANSTSKMLGSGSAETHVLNCAETGLSPASSFCRMSFIDRR